MRAQRVKSLRRARSAWWQQQLSFPPSVSPRAPPIFFCLSFKILSFPIIPFILEALSFFFSLSLSHSFSLNYFASLYFSLSFFSLLMAILSPSLCRALRIGTQRLAYTAVVSRAHIHSHACIYMYGLPWRRNIGVGRELAGIYIYTTWAALVIPSRSLARSRALASLEAVECTTTTTTLTTAQHPRVSTLFRSPSETECVCT